MPSSTAPPRRVVFAALDGVELLDVAGPATVFSAACRLFRARGRPAPYVVTLAGTSSTVGTSIFPVEATPLPQVRGPVDTLLVGGSLDLLHTPLPKPWLAWLRRVGRRARRVGSICTGALVLAELGWLDGRRATTHWLAAPVLAARYPAVRVAGDAIHVRDGRVVTSAGVSAGIDLALALVEEDLGHEVALEIARLLVVFLHRPGGQSQFSVALRHRATDDERVRELQRAIAEHPALDHRIPALARRARMSERHFVRVFTAQAGVSPGQFVRRVRVEAAQRALERSRGDLEAVANGVGFGSADVMRRAFLAVLGVTPSDYRDRFAHIPRDAVGVMQSA